jgi:hypothetical protein
VPSWLVVAHWNLRIVSDGPRQKEETVGRRTSIVAIAGAIMTVAGLASVSAASASTAAHQNVHPQTAFVVEVPAASSNFVDTGIDVTAGDNVTIKSVGKVIYRSDMPATNAVGWPVASQKCASGLPTGPYANDNLPCLSLIGAMGSSPAFEVGRATTIDGAEGGELYLQFNDNEFDDNSGHFNVTITVS